MAIPSYYRFIDPLLRYLARHLDGVSKSEADEAVADLLGLSSDDRTQRLPSGKQLVYKNRMGWAHDRLKRAGLSTSPRFGLWQLTSAGAAFVKKYPKALPEAEVIRLSNMYKDGEALKDGGTPLPPATQAASVTLSPSERIEHALAELRESLSRDLLELIGQAPPAFFENLVLDLLHSMGYGTSRDALVQVGGSGDGGIDGIISLDRLGLEKVYVQAKRWKNTVGRPEIQGFYGALAGRRANKGVFITTSAFSKEAHDFATQVEKIVLVDGSHLTALMIEHGVGVSHQQLKLPKLDSDYFEDGLRYRSSLSGALDIRRATHRVALAGLDRGVPNSPPGSTFGDRFLSGADGWEERGYPHLQVWCLVHRTSKKGAQRHEGKRARDSASCIRG
jgi:restriction system protein